MAYWYVLYISSNTMIWCLLPQSPCFVAWPETFPAQQYWVKVVIALTSNVSLSLSYLSYVPLIPGLGPSFIGFSEGRCYYGVFYIWLSASREIHTYIYNVYLSWNWSSNNLKLFVWMHVYEGIEGFDVYIFPWIFLLWHNN